VYAGYHWQCRCDSRLAVHVVDYVGILSVVSCLCFFFSSRRRHTRSLCDWSSDVCSSDLRQIKRHTLTHNQERSRRPGMAIELEGKKVTAKQYAREVMLLHLMELWNNKIRSSFHPDDTKRRGRGGETSVVG